ncbi:hypothetical protein J7E73_13555 [Paenibacillus albidus]|uniref:hypothetical protein n=1 Tax=Paenibacillus albidus TaxID=2041023 RepID=UPI001BE52020|nr:hypothetical protein [Paenibacillus albidus]MBT2290149.1 hypothetical protein [Paenibacillus albidus]
MVAIAPDVILTPGQNVPLSITSSLNGTAIQHPNATDFVLAPNQQYAVDYNVVGEMRTANTDHGFSLNLNGVLVPGSGSNLDTFQEAVPREGTFVNSSIVTTGAGQILFNFSMQLPSLALQSTPTTLPSES